MDNWLAVHPDKECVEDSYEEFVSSCEVDEWFYYLLLRLQHTPELRYQQENQHIYGFKHSGIDGGADCRECLPGCRFYPDTGRIEDLEVIQSYRKNQHYDEVYNAWLETANKQQ